MIPRYTPGRGVSRMYPEEYSYARIGATVPQILVLQQPGLLFERPRRGSAKNNAGGSQNELVPLAQETSAPAERESPGPQSGNHTIPPFPSPPPRPLPFLHLFHRRFTELARSRLQPPLIPSRRGKGGGVAASDDSLRFLASQKFQSAHDGYAAAAARGVGVRVGIGVELQLGAAPCRLALVLRGHHPHQGFRGRARLGDQQREAPALLRALRGHSRGRRHHRPPLRPLQGIRIRRCLTISLLFRC